MERLRLERADCARYYAPVAICGYLAALCVALVVTAAFLPNRHEALAVTAAALFGLVLSGALGLGMLTVQLRELRYLAVTTGTDAKANFERVAHLAHSQGWLLAREEPGRRLDARTADTMVQRGELIVVLFRDRQVLVACICDPDVGFSLVGRRRCQQHRELVSQAVEAAAA
ncbi:MAG TPA: hypothetical protein VGF89_12995 [Steroidobacteraceae bacterium]